MAANTRHLKRSNMPNSWPIKRKNIKFIARPNPGSHKKDYVVSIVVLIRDVLKYAATSKDVKYIVNHEEILVNGRKITDIKFAVGLFDVVEIKKTNEKYTIMFDEFGRIKLVPVKDDLIYLKLANKSISKGKKYQFNFSNGYNIIVNDKEFKATNVNDTIVYDFLKKKVVKNLALKDGTQVYIFDGKFKGQIATIKKFVSYNGISRDVAEITIGKEVHTTAKDYLFALDKVSGGKN